MRKESAALLVQDDLFVLGLLQSGIHLRLLGRRNVDKDVGDSLVTGVHEQFVAGNLFGAELFLGVFELLDGRDVAVQDELAGEIAPFVGGSCGGGGKKNACQAQ